MKSTNHTNNAAIEERLLRLREVTRRVGLSRSTIYLRISEGDFPAPIKLSANVAVWPKSQIDAWISRTIKEVEK